ncbi:MAG TPA: biotin/lipoyl-binding protein, partial [Microbacterium sp.]|uniref:efflux RND transporter periplasmic adaptor subunit n=1 Tax=Microbacterium sp. TaxID=51671 RepID=UPI002B481D91
GGGFGIASAASASAGGPDYRTATVGTGPVTQSLELTGTVSRVNQKTASFPVSGTVASVSVAVGDTVRAGQRLATLDPTALKANLLAAQATLARDQASLAADQSSSTTGSAASTATTGASGVSAGRSAGSGTGALQAQLARADRSLGQIRNELVQANTLCRPVTGTVTKTGGGPAGRGGAPTSGAGATPSPTPSPTVSPTSTPTPTPTSTSSPSPSPSTGGGASTPSPAQVAACEQALASIAGSLQVTEQQVSALAHAVSASASRGSSGQGASFGGATSGASAPRSGGSGSGATSQAARIASDQAAIAQDNASVSQAQADVQDATLTAPISGTVAFVGFVAGSDASTSQGVTIIGAGAAVVTVDIPLADMSLVHTGLAAQVTPAGGMSSVAGAVQSVQLLPSSSASSTAFPATVLVADPPTALASGSAATVSIVTATATDAVRVPASALSGRDGQTGVVTVLSGSSTTRTVVQLGAVGGGWVQVTSGLKAGQQVVLADAAEALPSNTTGLGGGGFAGGGFRTGTSGTFRGGAGAGG